MNVETRVRETATPEGTIRSRVAGTGPPLVCLHGLSAHGVSWDPLLRLVSDRFTLHVPDLLGRGASDAPEATDYDLESEVRRVRRVVDDLADSFLVVGHSHGAAIALALARRDRRCRAGVLANPVTPWTRRPRWLELLRLGPVRRALAPALRRYRVPATRFILERRVFADPGFVDPQVVRRYAAPFEEPDRVRALLQIVRDWRPAELEDHLPERRMQFRLLAGELDRRIRVDEVRRLGRRLGAEVEILTGVAHGLPEERPDAVAGAVGEVAAAVFP